MGLGCDLDTLRRICADDVDATRLIREVTTNPNGVHKGRGDDNIISRRSDVGTSKSYTLDRLHRERPDLYAEVKAGGMSANRAAIEAGFRRPTKTVYADSAADAVRTLLTVYTHVELMEEMTPPTTTLQHTCVIDVCSVHSADAPRMEFIETPTFTKYITKLLPDTEYAALQAYIAKDPERVPPLRGTGGARKIRWALGRMDK